MTYDKPEIGHLLDQRLMQALSARCSHDDSPISDARFGEHCAKCLDLAYVLLEVVDNFGPAKGRKVKDHPNADERRTYQVGFFVWVEVESFDEGEAGIVAEAALGWPGSWANREPVESEGVINGYRVQARVTRTQALTAKLLEQ